MTFPSSGTPVQIESYKHNGNLHRVWHDSLVLYGREDVCVVANDKTVVTESDGRTWTTREPAICYFYAAYWFNVIGMLREDGIYYYCNIGSPFIYDADMNVLKYIDYDLDVKVYPDMNYDLVDEDEYELHKQEMGYPGELDDILYRNIDYLLRWIRQQKGPFSSDHINQWYERFLTYR